MFILPPLIFSLLPGSKFISVFAALQNVIIFLSEADDFTGITL